ncbi:MAG: Rrf2 family transcriptional regulator [Actinomycetota bacterium]
MRIELGQTGDYAVRSVLALARAGRRLKGREIASEMDLPEKFLPQVLGALIKAGLVTSLAGPDGGYALARPAREISLLEVIEASEGPVRSQKCVLRGGPCRLDGTCAVHDAWFDAQAALEAKLARTSFAGLRREALRARPGLGRPDEEHARSGRAHRAGSRASRRR